VSRTTPIGCRLSPCFSELVNLKARLAELLWEAQAVRDDGTGDHFCGNRAFFGYDGHPRLQGSAGEVGQMGPGGRPPGAGQLGRLRRGVSDDPQLAAALPRAVWLFTNCRPASETRRRGQQVIARGGLP
jgi:hypothetical protein